MSIITNLNYEEVIRKGMLPIGYLTEMWESEVSDISQEGISFVNSALQYYGLSIPDRSDPEWMYNYLNLLGGGFGGPGVNMATFIYWAIQQGYLVNSQFFIDSFSESPQNDDWSRQDIYDNVFVPYQTLLNDPELNEYGPDSAWDEPLSSLIQEYQMYASQFLIYRPSGDVSFKWCGCYYDEEIIPDKFKSNYFNVNTPPKNYLCIATDIYGLSYDNDDYLLCASIDLSKYSLKFGDFSTIITLNVVDRTTYDEDVSYVFSASNNNVYDVYKFKDKNVGSELYTYLENNYSGNGEVRYIPIEVIVN